MTLCTPCQSEKSVNKIANKIARTKYKPITLEVSSSQPRKLINHKEYIFDLASDFAEYLGFQTSELIDGLRHEKTGFLHMRNQSRRSAVQLISAFAFATYIVQSLFFLNPIFQASSHLLWLSSLNYVGPYRKPKEQVSLRRLRFCFQISELIVFHLMLVISFKKGLIF